jgi:hypothetical protein
LQSIDQEAIRRLQNKVPTIIIGWAAARWAVNYRVAFQNRSGTQTKDPTLTSPETQWTTPASGVS